MKVELCTQAQKEEALDVPCDAFHEYPVMRYVLADSGPDYDGDLRALIDLFCQARLTHGLSLYGIRHDGPWVAVSVHQRPHRADDTASAARDGGAPDRAHRARGLGPPRSLRRCLRSGRSRSAVALFGYAGHRVIPSAIGVRQGPRRRDQGTCPLQRRFAGDSPQHGDGEEYPLLREARFQGRGGGRRRSRPYVEHVLVM